MKEILFRAKRKDNGEWIEGYYYKRIQEGKVVDAIERYNGNIDSIEYYEIYQNTLCQFTGKNDKSGNKIWENDIVSAVWYSYIEPIEDITGRVIFDQEWCAYVICDECMKTKSELNGCGAYTYEFEVLGNVFDNLELIYDED